MTITKLTHYKKLKAMEEEIKRELETLKAELIEEMEGQGKVTCGQYIVTLTPCTRKSIDERRLKEERPEIAEEYEKVTEYERFTVK